MQSVCITLREKVNRNRSKGEYSLVRSSWAPGVLARVNRWTDGWSSSHLFTYPLAQMGLCPIWVKWEERVSYMTSWRGYSSPGLCPLVHPLPHKSTKESLHTELLRKTREKRLHSQTIYAKHGLRRANNIITHCTNPDHGCQKTTDMPIQL